MAMALGLLTLSASCVTQSKFDALHHQKQSLETENNACAEALQISDEKNKNLEANIDELKNSKYDLENKLKDETASHDKLKKNYESLDNLYNNLVYNSGKLNENLSAKQKYLENMQSDFEETRAKNEQLASELEKREQRLLELERIIASQQKQAEDLKAKVDNALIDFEINDINVKIENGQVYVILPDKLLFKSGSIDVDTSGANAIKQVAQAIKQQDNFEVIVEGHTDNVPISKFSKYMRDNWDLSTARANSVIRILKDAGVDETIIHSTGRGESKPVAENDSPENKRLNRRIEIILKPKMTEFYNILGTDNTSTL